MQSLPIFDVSTTTYIRDGMALVQSLNAKRYSTFGDLAMDFVKMQLDCFSSASTVTDVFDRYDIKNSIKSAERERRSKSVFSCRVFQVLETRTIPDWKKFLNSGENKQSLIRFLGEYSVKHLTNTSILNEGQTLYLAGAFKSPEIVKMVDYEGVSDCSHLFSNHEEADTRMVLHAMQADTIFRKNKQQGRIVVKSPDTDVLVLLVHFFPRMSNTSELWFQTGMVTNIKDCRRFIPVHELCESLHSVLCTILPAAHAVTGCDTTSSLFEIGKKISVEDAKTKSRKFC